MYLGLYSLVTQILGGVFLLPGLALPPLGTLPPLREITIWCAERVFGVTSPLLQTGNSADTVFHWVQNAWVLALALVMTAVWARVDRSRASYARLHIWFRLFVRFALAAQMFYYGLAKVIPTQFPEPGLVMLVTPVGNFSLSDLLWAFMGASTGYQVFTGLAEVAAGVLLLAPKTTLLGALIALVDMVQVFVLNMTYDFGLKQFSFHLILLAIFLLAPDLRRLRDGLLFGRGAGRTNLAPLFSTSRANRTALVAQILFGVYLIGMFTSLNLRYWRAEGGGGGPRSPLYGIWNVEEMSVDGAVRPVARNDYDRRWRRVIFDLPHVLVFQRTDGSLAHFAVTIDPRRRTLALTRRNTRSWNASFTFERPAADRLLLSGTMDDDRITMRLRLVGLDTFRLRSSTFRWIRPPDPFAG